MSWASIVNQSRVKELLIASIKRNRLAHAYLFTGSEGSGKYAMAIELAKVVNCEQANTDACDVCSSCIKFNNLQHPNVKLIFSLPVGKGEKATDSPYSKLSDNEITLIQEQLGLKALNPYHQIKLPKANTIKVNSIREIRREASMTTFGKGKKVFIILDAENMNDEASNAILKTLEEPHEDTLLILTSSNPAALLSTIISRCQHIRFDPLTEEVISQALQEGKGVDAEQALSIARLADGSYTRALQYLDTSLMDRKDYAVKLLRTMLFKPRTVFLREIETITSGYQRSEIKDILRLMQQWLHDAMMVEQGLIDGLNDRDNESLKKFVVRYRGWNYAGSCESLERAISLLEKNVYIPLIMLNLSSALKDHIGIS